MKKFTLSCIGALLIMLVIGNFTLHAQTTVQIGTGTSVPVNTLYSPLYRFTATSTTTGSRANILFTQAELSAAGINNGDIISAIAFNKTNVANFVTPASYKVYMANTTNTTLATSLTWASILTTHTEAFSSTSYNVPSAAGWVTINVTPFTYTGGSLEIAHECTMVGNGGATDAFKWEYTSGNADKIVGVASPTGATLNGTVAAYKERPNIQITYTSAAACTSPPTAGNAQAGITTTCSGTNVPLSLTNNSSGSGQSYVWQSATAMAGPYTDISTSATTFNYTVVATATRYYRCAVTCSGNTTYSTPVLVNVNPALTGVYTINSSLPTGGTNFQTFAEAITAINCGISGAVTFNVPAGQTFTEPLPELTATGTATNTITFQKTGTGSNPVIMPGTAGTIASSTTLASNGDGVIVINGGDYITFDGIDVNTTNFASGSDMYEYGYYLKKVSGTDACKNVTIKNATISLNRSAIFSFGIFISNNSGTSTGITVTTTGGRSENIKVYGNTINNSYGGILVRGFAAASPYDLYDQNIEIGVDAPNNIVEIGGGATTTYGIYTIYQNNLKVANNIISSVQSGQTGTMYGIYATTSVNANGEFYKNNVTLTGGGTTNSIYAIYTEMGGTGTNNLVKVYDNIVSNCTYPTATSGSMYLIYIGGTVYKVDVYGNKVFNNIHTPTTTGALYCIYQIGSTVNEVRIHDNLVYGNSKSTGTTGVIYGIYNNPTATTTSYIYNDTVYNIYANGTTAILYGIFQTTGLATHTYGNTVYDLMYTGTTGGAYGIAVAGGTENNVYNNFISDIKAPTTSAVTDGVRGISITATTTNATVNVSYNSIYLNASSSGSDFSASGIFHTASATATTAALSLRNNIIVNQSFANGNGYASAIRLSGTSLSNFATASNNNLLATGTGGSNQVVFFDGTNADFTLGDYKARVSPRESATVTEVPPFVNIATAPFDLHLKTTVPTQAEGRAIPITTITTDYDGNARSATTPDIGADEFNGIGADLSGPSITYTAVPVKTVCTSAPTITATITDPSNVNTTAGTKPRLWYKKEIEGNVLPGSNTAAGNGWKWVEATNATSPFTFTFDFSLLSSALAPGDSISYFIVAQDIAATPNVGANAATFNSTPATVALSSGAFPATGNVRGFRILSTPNPLTIKVNRTEICNSGTVTLDVDGVDVTGGSYQWQSSPHNANNFTNISNGTTIPFTTAALTDSTDFRLVINCGGNPIAGSPSNVVSVNVNNPQLISSTGATRCGPGSVTLTATAPGFDISWYSVPTAGVALGTGNTFVTPVVSSNTTFYAAANTGGFGSVTGKPTITPNPTSGAGLDNFGLVFNVLAPVTLHAVDVFATSANPGTAGTVKIDVIDGSGTVVHTATVNVTGNPIGSVVAETVILDFNLLPGTNYKLRHSSRSAGISGLAFDPSANAPSGGNYGYPYVVPGVLEITTSTLTAAPTNTARNDLYYYFYNWQVATGCEGTRVPVVATIATPPALTISPNKTICNNAVDSLEVTSGIANFNSFVWSPTTDLYTNAAATIPYNGTNATKVYVKSSTSGKTVYSCLATNSSTNCTNLLTDTVWVLPVPSVASSKAELCNSGTTTLSATPATDYGYGTLQWQSSPTGSTYTDISNATGATYTTPNLTATTYYRLAVKDGVGSVCSLHPLTVIVNTPAITATNPGYTCGTGTVTLSATANSGATINWYTAATGGAAIASGNTFVTPSISTSTNYYVSASIGGSPESMPSPTAGTSVFITPTTGWGLRFTVNNTITINSVKVYANATAAGTANIQIKISDLTDAVLYTGTAYSFNIGTSLAEYTIPVNITVPPGNYKMGMTYSGIGNMVRESSGVSFPYTSSGGSVSITAGANGTGSAQTTAAYYWFYQWDIASGCESARTEVLATVNNDPGCSPVPVTLASFTGERRGNANLLSWNTATEINNKGFELQRSADGITYSNIAFVNSKAENGNSSSMLNYAYTDEKITATASYYYRLKQIDKDGKYNYSNAVFIKGSKANKLELVSVYPNPAKDQLNIKLASPKADNVTLIITDITGKVVLRQNKAVLSGDNQLQLNLQQLSQGSYLLKAICADGCETSVSKFVKQ